MGFFDRHIRPRVTDWGCGQAAMMAQRQAIVPQARGRVLEIGIGSGLNLQYYDPAQVRGVVGIDPSAGLLAFTQQRIKDAPVGVELVQCSAEATGLPSGSFDTAVVTFSLCSIPDIEAALAEVRRLLTPGGALLFLEHGRSSEDGLSRWQDRLNPLWRRLTGGCNLNRDVFGLIHGAGFRIDQASAGPVQEIGFALANHLYRGIARPE